MQKRKLEQMEQDWNRAVEQAHTNETRDHALDTNQLDSAAGLNVKSGVKAGGWLPATYTQGMTCGCTN